MTDIDRQTEWLEALVERTRRRLRRNAVLAGVALLELAVVGWLLVAAGVDALIVLPGWARRAAWAGFWAVLLGGLAALIVWPALRPMPRQRVAFVIERAMGRMHNRLVSVLDLRHGRVNAEPASQTFYQRLVEQTAERMAHYEVDRVADPRPARRMLMAAVALLLVGMAGMIAFGDRLPTAMHRVLAPGADIPPATGVRFAASIGRHAAVLQGEPLTIQARLTRGSLDDLKLRLKAEGKPWASYPMQRSDDRFEWTLDAVDQSYAFQLVGGGTWTRPGTIEMLRRPIVDAVDASVELPRYMNLPERRPVDRASEQISAPRGAVLHLSVRVSGDAAEGEAQLWREATREATETVASRRVWFDDALPDDATFDRPWRWVAEDPFSGERAHTFDWELRPYGFETRLNPLVLNARERLKVEEGTEPLAVGPAERFVVHARLDPAAPPRQLRVGVKRRGGDGWRWLIWGEPIDGARGDRVRIGPLPTEAGWRRLEVPAAQLKQGGIGERIELVGLRFAVDGGRAWFDRPEAVRRTERTVERTDLRPLRTVALSRDPETGRWVGRVPVERDHKLTLRFTNRRGDANAPMRPIAVAAVADRPPSLVVERPGRSVTLDKAASLPIVVRAFDDFGVASVGVQFGRSPEQIAKRTKRLARYDQPRTSRLVMGAISPEALGIAPGAHRYYQVVVRDRAGQTASSSPYRLALAEPRDADESTATASSETGRKGLLGAIEGLLGGQRKLADAVGSLVDRLPAGVEFGEGGGGEIKLVDAGGEPLSDAERRRVYRQWAEALGETDGEALRGLGERLAERRERLSELAGRLAEAAAGASESATALPIEPAALRSLAEQARALAGRTDPGALDAETQEAALRQLAELRARLPEQEAALSAMREQVEGLDQTRRALETDPQAAQRRMGEMMTRVQARRAAEQLDALNQHLQSQARAMADRAARRAKLAERAAYADAEELGAMSRRTREAMDPEARALLERAQRLLAERRAERQRDGAPPPAPWAPAGATGEALPVERDTPAEDDAAPADAEEDAEAARQRRLAQLQEMIERLESGEEPDWWDQPVDTPAGATAREMSERYEGRNRPTERGEPEAGEAGGKPSTPRQQLRAHHEQWRQALTESSEQARGAADAVSRMMGQLQRTLAGEQAGQAQAAGPAGQPALESALQSPRMQQAMAMARRAARQQAQAAARAPSRGAPGARGGPPQSQASPPAAGQAGESGATPPSAVAMPGMTAGAGGGGGPRPGGEVVLRPGQGEDADPEARAALYRLPPEVRQPLIQAIREKGPAAYQPFIDAYYRQLSRKTAGEAGDHD